MAMNKIKVQFIGIKSLPQQEDDEFFRPRKCVWDQKGYYSAEELSFHDYHIVFINYPYQYPYPTESSDFLTYLHGGGVVVVFVGPNTVYPWGSSKDFLSLSGVAGGGETIKPKASHWLNSILDKSNFNWHCFITQGGSLAMSSALRDALNDIKGLSGKTDRASEIFEITGTTLGGECVSAIIHYGIGKLILLPLPKNPIEIPNKLIRQIIDGIKDNYFPKNEILKEAHPAWLGNWEFSPEIKILKERDSIIEDYRRVEQELKHYEDIKRILWAHDIELVSAVSMLLKELGFDVQLVENKGRQDIEIKHNDFSAIIEVKGLKAYANNDDLRELLDWYVTASKENPNVKGILILNHFRGKDLIDRENEQPLTEAALNIAKNNKFCVLTTMELFKIYEKFLAKKIKLEQIRDKMAKAKGIVTF